MEVVISYRSLILLVFYAHSTMPAVLLEERRSIMLITAGHILLTSAL